MRRFAIPMLLASASFAAPAVAQDSTPDAGQQETVFDGDYLSVGGGVALSPSYSGSDDYVVFPLPVVQGSYKGITITPRAGGAAIDFIPNPKGATGFNLGVVAKLNLNRTRRIADPVVKRAGELDTAVMVGPTAGVTLPAVLNPYDSLTVTVDSGFDVAGANDGFTITPSVTYFTPLSRAMAVSLSVNAQFIDNDYANYYYSVTPAQSLASGLPLYKADGGLESVGGTLFLGYDLSGDLTDGGFAVIGFAGYSRLFGDAKNTPFTSIRGSADQAVTGAGLVYTF